MTKSTTSSKAKLHSRSVHKESYNFKLLIKANPDLEPFVKETQYGNDSIDFFNPKAVLALNKALLKHHYQIKGWNIPEGYLCPPIPGRADYIHYAADLLSNGKEIPTGTKIKCLDLGVGASCIYPLVANAIYGWSFIASDIDRTALAASQKIIDNNVGLDKQIDLRLQKQANQLLKGVIQKNEFIDLVVCNPPFHSSAAQAKSAAEKKASNLKKRRIKNPLLNFGGQQNELWCPGGEYQFVKTLISESKQFAKQCNWFTSLISKKDTLKHMYVALESAGVKEVKTIEMNTGNKSSRILCWTFK